MTNPDKKTPVETQRASTALAPRIGPASQFGIEIITPKTLLEELP